MSDSAHELASPERFTGNSLRDGSKSRFSGKFVFSGTNSHKPRLRGVDIWRFVAACCVILIHTADRSHFNFVNTGGFSDVFGIDLGAIIDHLARFAVPFFFLASGYFLKEQPNRRLSEVFWKQLKRIGPIYLVWTSVYVLLEPDRMAWFTRPELWLRWLLNGGPAFQLWFLPALLFSSVLSIALRRIWKTPLTLAVVLAIYLVGVFIEGYLPLIRPNPDIIFRTFARDVCFGPVFVTVGMWLNRHRRPSVEWGYILCGVGLGLQIFEGWVLNHLHITPFYRTDYLIGTLPYAVGVFVIAVRRRYVSRFGRKVANLGRLALGIFAVHVIFVNILSNYLPTWTLTDRLILASVVLFCSICVVSILDRLGPLRQYVRA